MKVKSLSQVRLLATPWTAAYQAPPSMGFSRQEYWTGVPLPSLPISYSPHHVQTRFQRKLTLLIESVIILPSGNSDCHNIFLRIIFFENKQRSSSLFSVPNMVPSCEVVLNKHLLNKGMNKEMRLCM